MDWAANCGMAVPRFVDEKCGNGKIRAVYTVFAETFSRRSVFKRQWLSSWI
jgi:hypothetical protein